MHSKISNIQDKRLFNPTIAMVRESQESSNQGVQSVHDKFCRKENELQGKTNNFFMGACVCHVWIKVRW